MLGSFRLISAAWRRSLKKDARLEKKSRLRRVGKIRAECEPGCGIARPEMGELRSREKDLVLVSRSHGDRPGIAAGTVEKIGSAAGGAAGAADVLEPDG